MSRDHYPLLWRHCGHGKHSFLYCWAVFTELLPGNALIKFVTSSSIDLNIVKLNFESAFVMKFGIDLPMLLLAYFKNISFIQP
jgi:hypothetical protein